MRPPSSSGAFPLDTGVISRHPGRPEDKHVPSGHCDGTSIIDRNPDVMFSKPFYAIWGNKMHDSQLRVQESFVVDLTE